MLHSAKHFVSLIFAVLDASAKTTVHVPGTILCDRVIEPKR